MRSQEDSYMWIMVVLMFWMFGPGHVPHEEVDGDEV
jgi:hypothetical protein